MSTPLPLSVEEITPAWLGSALGVDVASVDVESIIWGTATKVFVKVEYAAPTADVGPPTMLCVKGGFNAGLRPMACSGYFAEAWFYESIAQTLDVELPRCWYTGADTEAMQGIVILDDLRATGTTFPDMTTPMSVDDVAAALDQQARWHAATWGGAGLDRAEWLTVGSPVQRSIIEMMLGADHWSHHLSLPRGEALPDSLRNPDRILAGFKKYWAADDDAALALSHGDAHMGNLFTSSGQQQAFLDWQGVCKAPWSDDVAYLVGGALSPEDRRANERDLLQHYLKQLGSAGAAAPSMDDAWPDYLGHYLHGIVWLLVPEAMQPEDVCHAMGARYAQACADHDIFNLLGV